MYLRRWIPLLGAPVACLCLLLLPHHLKVNWTPSLPVGLYRATSAPVRRGGLVAACPPPALAAEAIARGFLPPGSCSTGTEPLLKIVAGTAGDAVLLDTSGVWINGALLRNSAPRHHDRGGRRLVPSRFRGTIPAGYLWLHGPHPRSWDSRYFGPVPAASVTCSLRELLTFP